MKRLFFVFVSLIITAPPPPVNAQSCGAKGHIPIAHGHKGSKTTDYKNATYSSICWGYAQGRAFGRQKGNSECDPTKTYISKINESEFSYVGGASLNGIALGDIIVFGQVREDENGHAAFVTYIPAGFDGTWDTIKLIKVDQIPAPNMSEQKGVTVDAVQNAQGYPVGYHNGRGSNGSACPTDALVFQNSFGGGILYVGIGMDGAWQDFPGSFILRNYNRYSCLDIKAVDNQFYQGYNRVFRYWQKSGSGSQINSLQTNIVITGAATWTAEFLKDCNITFRNKFIGVSSNPGTIKVDGATNNSPHQKTVLETYQVAGTALNQIYNGINYTFTSWDDGNTQYSRTLTASVHDTLTANFTGKPNGMTNYNLQTNSTVGEKVTLSWTVHPNVNVSYEVWRKGKDGSTGQWFGPDLIATLSHSTTSYTDLEYEITAGYTDDMLQYDVRAYYSVENSYADQEYITVYGKQGGIAPKRSGKTEPSLSRLPESYSVSAYPNPFNPETKISYQIKEQAQITLTIYDIMGRRLAVLVDAEQAVGYYRKTWHAQDAVGRKLPSGVYLYRFTARPVDGKTPFQKLGKLLLTR